jgi:hypothetical protein
LAPSAHGILAQASQPIAWKINGIGSERCNELPENMPRFAEPALLARHVRSIATAQSRDLVS